MRQFIRKAGRLIPYIATGDGPIERLCAMACCRNLAGSRRHILLPCGCHGLITKCTCPIRDTHCRTCKRCFITTTELKGKEWFEIKDPHGLIFRDQSDAKGESA